MGQIASFPIAHVVVLYKIKKHHLALDLLFEAWL